MMNIGQQLAELRRMTVGGLRREYVRVFQEETRSHHKDYLYRRIAWGLQANAEGGLPERARARALEIARDSDLRTRAPSAEWLRGSPVVPMGRTAVVGPVEVRHDERLPMPGAVLTRQYRGRAIRVRVLPHPQGFDYEGTVYRSLSAVAQAVTGAHWNGYLFFNIPAAIPAPRRPSQEKA